MLNDKKLKAKGFIPQSARAAMVGGGFTPVKTCSPEDFKELPPQVRSKYEDTPRPVVGKIVAHHLK